MQKNGEKMKKISELRLPCIAFSITGALYLLYFAVFGFYPFGERSIAWCDLEQQYLPILMELRNALLEGTSLLLGRGGGGMNLWGVILFFVSSPIGILSLLCSEDNMIYFINILTIVKLAICAASASWFFRKMFKRLPDCFNIILSVIYPLSGYVMMYYQNNMWLDVMAIFPLLLLSMFRLCDCGKWRSYTIFLSLTMLMNFYISYMIVLYIVISFGVMLLFCCKKNNRADRSLKFAAGSFCAAVMTAVIWMPAMKQFLTSGRGESFIEKFTDGNILYNTVDKLAQLLCTSAAVGAVIFTLIRLKRFRSGRPAFFASMTAVMLVGTLIEPINKLWHTGSYQAYPLRFGFIIILLCLSLCAEILSGVGKYKIPENSQKRRFFAVSAAVFALALVVYIIGIANHKKYNSYTSVLWVSRNSAMLLAAGAIAAIACVFIFISYQNGSAGRKTTALMLSGIVLFESFFSFGVYFDNITDVTSRFNQTIALSGKINDENFYRAKSLKRYFYSNMMEGMNYNSIGHYTSLTDGDFLFAAKRLGYSAYWMDVSSNGGTLISDAFLMNKYFFGLADDKNGFMDDYNMNDTLKIYRNTVVPSGAVISSVSPDELGDFSKVQRMPASSYMAEVLFGEKNIIHEVEPYTVKNLNITRENGKIKAEIIDPDESASLNYNFHADGKIELYADLFGNYSTALKEPYFESVSIKVNGKTLSSYYPNKKENGILDLGTFNNKYVSVKIEVHKNFEAEIFGLYTMDAERIAEHIQNVPTAQISLDGNKIKITADSPDGGWAYVPFAYNDGFSAKINGEKTALYKAFGSFMAIQLENGKNEIELAFYPEGFKIGIIISCFGGLMFIVLMILMKQFRISHKIGKIFIAGIYASSAGVLLLLYVFAPAVWLVMQFIG